MKKRERDIETWKDIVREINELLDCDGRAHGRLIRGWLVDQDLELAFIEGGKEDE